MRTIGLSCVAVLACLTIALVPGSGSGATFVVTENNSDASDANPGDGFCSTSSLPSGPCTLRAAIQEANTDSVRDRIEFGSGLLRNPDGFAFVIPFSALPVVTQPLVIDGTTDPAFSPTSSAPTIQLVGNLAGAGVHGIQFAAADCELRAVAVTLFGGSGVTISGVRARLVANHIGLGNGANESGNGSHGIHVEPGADFAVIADDDFVVGTGGAGNTIVGSGGAGILLQGHSAVVASNRIGLDPLALEISAGSARSNQGWGISIVNGDDATIGGELGAQDERNWIADNGEGGIRVNAFAAGTRILGNTIGLSGGLAAVGNGGPGIEIEGDDTTVGGPTGPNVIGYSDGPGVEVGISIYAANDTSILANEIFESGGHGIQIGDGARIVIDDNDVMSSGLDGIHLNSQTAGVVVTNNRVGASDSETAPSNGSAQDGILDAGNGNQIGGPSAGNVIGNSGDDGIDLAASAMNAILEGNFIGVTPSAASDVGNGGNGIELSGSGHRIGSCQSGAGNEIGFNGPGIWAVQQPTQLTIQGNFIGRVVRSGGAEVAVPNAGNGIDMNAVTTAVIGSPVGATQPDLSNCANWIAGNTQRGVEIDFGSTDAVTVRGNRIFDNGGLGVDLGLHGRHINDPGDADTGSNNLQNSPVLASADRFAGTGDLAIQYAVDSDVAHSAYPLTVDFYRADATLEEPQAWIGEASIPAVDAGRPVSTIFAPFVPVSAGEFLVALATDADGNSSEAWLPVVVPEPSLPVLLWVGSGGLCLVARKRSSATARHAVAVAGDRDGRGPLRTRATPTRRGLRAPGSSPSDSQVSGFAGR